MQIVIDYCIALGYNNNEKNVIFCHKNKRRDSMLNYKELVKNINVLLADDDEDYIMVTVKFLEMSGYHVDIATNGQQALDMLHTNQYQIALLDYFMPELNGEEVIKEIRKTNTELIIILQTGFSGTKPPLQMMETLNIQNYYDKTEGIDRLNLELLSAVRIFNQQNEIRLKRFKSSAIGTLAFGVAQEIKTNLLSVGAGLEFTNLSLQEAEEKPLSKEALTSMTKYYENSKISLERIDRVLSAIINQSTDNSSYIMSDNEVSEILNLILAQRCKLRNVIFSLKVALKTDSYISGGINDVIFMICDIVGNLIELAAADEKIEMTMAEDENKWYFNIENSNVSKLSTSYLYLLQNVTVSLENTHMETVGNKIVLSILK